VLTGAIDTRYAHDDDMGVGICREKAVKSLPFKGPADYAPVSRGASSLF